MLVSGSKVAVRILSLRSLRYLDTCDLYLLYLYTNKQKKKTLLA